MFLLGTRTSLYENATYLSEAPFAAMTLNAINTADPSFNGTLKKKPYMGVQFAAIPEFQGIATSVSQQISSALAGKISVEKALKNAQKNCRQRNEKSWLLQIITTFKEYLKAAIFI